MRAIDNAAALAARLQPPQRSGESRTSAWATAANVEAHIADEIARRGAELSSDPAFVAMLDRLPNLAELVVVGDSLSADRCSWVEQLRGALRSLGRAQSIRNLARAGSTATDALAQLPRAASGPRASALVMLGTNDLRRFNHNARSRIPLPETLSSLERIVTVLEDFGHDATLVTPQMVDGERAARWPHFINARIAWNPEDHAALVAGTITLAARRGIAIITLTESDSIELSADGVHPTVAGHTRLLRILLERLAARA